MLLLLMLSAYYCCRRGATHVLRTHLYNIDKRDLFLNAFDDE